MTEALAPSLGRLPFSLPPGQLRGTGEKILAEAGARLDAIESLGGPRTVQNTLEPLNRLMVEVYDLANHGRFVFVTHPDAAHRTAGREVGEAADRFFNAARLRTGLFRALGEVDPRPLDAAGRHALEKLLREMRRAGVELGAPERENLRALNDEVDRLSNQFADNANRLVRTVKVTDPEELAGLPADYRAAHPPNAEGAVEITTRYPDAFPVFLYAQSSELRRRLMLEFLDRAYPENIPVLREILAKRHAIARLLGYRNYAEYIIEDKMMGSTRAAWEFLDRISGLLRAPSEAHRARLLARKRRDAPEATRLETWDGGGWMGRYYETRLRDEDFGVDTKALRAYLPYTGVRDGLLRLCERLFGLTIRPTSETELWHPTVEAYDVDRHGSPLGRFYLDLVPREGKFGHAAQFDLRAGIAGLQLPHAALVCNFLEPGAPKEEALMEYSDVVTFFHEFGHLLHALFSGHGRWLYATQGFIEWDFVEAPSLLFEEWARDPAVLRQFARRPGTGEPIPEEILSRLRSAESLGRANTWLFQVALSAVSLAYYDRAADGFNTSALLHERIRAYHSLDPPAETHPEAAWGHLTGYSALYYTYTWSLVIARDILSRFLEKGALTDPELARRYAETILAPGSGRPARELVREFLGREFDFAAFEKWALDDPYAKRGGAA